MSLITVVMGYFIASCEFVSDSQGGLGVHQVKKHKASDCDDIHSVSIICEYPKGKSFYCCICDTIIKSWPHFTRHFRAIHSNIPLFASAWCTLCNRQFKDLKRVGVHMNREHDISSLTIIPPSSDVPIMSSVNFVDSQSPNSPQLYDNVSRAGPPLSNRVNARRRACKADLQISNHCSNDAVVPTISDGPFSKAPSALATPASPPSQFPPNTQPSLDPVVAFSGCTAVDNPLPPSNPITLDSTVALNGCTDDDRIPTVPDSSPISKSQYPHPKRISRKKRNLKKRKVKPHSPSPVLSPALSSDISVEDFSPPDENSRPSTSHLHPTMEDITDAEDPIPSTPFIFE